MARYTNVSSPEIITSLTPDTIGPLDDLRKALWGHEDAFQHEASVQIPGRTIPYKYIDLTQYAVPLLKLAHLLEPRFLLRSEYIEAYNALILRDNEPKVFSSQPNGCVLVGQPGIGKSIFLIYILITRLRNRLPFAYQYSTSESLVFNERGVGKRYEGDAHWSASYSGIWALSNSTTKVDTPLVSFFKPPGVFVVQATSPRERQWKAWAKEAQVDTYVMNPWLDDELSCLSYSIVPLNITDTTPLLIPIQCTALFIT